MTSIEDRLTQLEEIVRIIEKRHNDRVEAMMDADEAIEKANCEEDHY